MVQRRSTILAIVPAYNEASSIEHVVQEIGNVQPPVDVLVVDDGSTDRTASISERAGARVLILPFNLGIGGAVQTGFRYAVEHGYEMAVQVDGDGQHIPSQIPQLVDALKKKHVDVIIGSRWVNSMVLRQTITDNTSGFRVFNRRAFVFLSENYPQDYPEPESVILLGRNGYTFSEVSIQMRERGSGKSSISALRSVYYMVKVLLAIFVDLFKEKIK
jgi:glycosyltransferase involved in cell wall biosynthesis